MEQERINQELCQLLRGIIEGKKQLISDVSCSAEEWKEIDKFSRSHKVEAFLYQGIKDAGCVIPAEQDMIENVILKNAFRVYDYVNFTAKVLEFFHENQIPGGVLKGLTLSRYYPKEETRYFGDLDFFIPDHGQYEKACKGLLDIGYELESENDYHRELMKREKDGKFYRLELHHAIGKPLKSERSRQQILRDFCSERAIWQEISVLGISILALKPLENAVYLTLHMAKHFMRGFGLRQLIDWIYFLRAEGKYLDKKGFRKRIDGFGIGDFSRVLTAACVTYLGMEPELYFSLFKHMPRKQIVDSFIEDILDAGEFGRRKKGRYTSATMECARGRGYGAELHEQMKGWFPKASRHVVLWPFLWFYSIGRFLKICLVEQNVSPFKIMKIDKRRKRLYGYLKLYEIEEEHEE